MTRHARLRGVALLALFASACQLGGLVGLGDNDEGGEGTPPPGSEQPAAIQSASGDGQSGVVAEDLAQPYTVRVTDDDGTPLRAVEVRWASVEGGGSVSPSTTMTDANGEARAVHRLGTVAGAQRVRATIASVSSLTVHFSSTARHGALDEIVFETDASDVSIATAMSPALRVVLRDRFGNVADQLTGTANVSITPGTGPLLGVLTGTLEASIQQGRAQFTDLRLGVPGNDYRLRVSTSGESADTRSFAVTLVGIR